MNKNLSMAVAGAVLAMGASAANAGITIPAGDWTIDIGGNVNAYYTHTKASGQVAGADATLGGGDTKNNVVQTGLLPSALGIGGKTRQNDLDIAFQFTFFTGVDSGNGHSAGNNSLNIRQAYMTFGDKSWGTIKMGRDLGIFGSDAILSDMTLLGVGVGAGAGGSSTLGRIGSGYVYADWVGQIQYASPNWNGFSFAVAMREPWNDGVRTSRRDMGFDAKASYEWAGDFAGKVWVGGLTEKHRRQVNKTAAHAGLNALGTAVTVIPAATTTVSGYTSHGWEIGGKVGFAGAELVGYYYDGKGLDGQLGAQVGGLQFLNGSKTDDNGGYVQASYKIPGVGTKLGLSWGENKSNDMGGVNGAELKNKSWIIGAYHPLTPSLNLVAEYTHQKVEGDSTYDANFGRTDAKYKTLSLGAILFF